MNSLRNPRALRTLIFNTIFVSLMVLALFWRVGKEANTLIELAQQIYNFIGLAFLMNNNIMFPAIMGVVI